MKSYLIACDLNNRYGDYQSLSDKVTSFDRQWYNCTKNTWIIKSNLSPSDIMGILENHIYGGDKILVIELVRNTSWYGLNREEEDWIRNNL